MPQQDRTGPQGKGPMTGRKQGRCAGKKTGEVDQATPTPRRGLGSRLGLRKRKGKGSGSGRGMARGKRKKTGRSS